MEKYDLLVIGAGPGGYYAAIHAAKKGVKTAIVEREKFGGTCLNYGCMPTKVMLDAVSGVVEKHSYMEVSLNHEKLFAHRNKAIQKLSGGIEFLLKKNKVDIFKGQGKFLDKSQFEIKNDSGDVTQITFDKAIIATGSSAKSLPFLEEFKKYTINSDYATNMSEIPETICIIGGGVIGIEFAYIYKGLGCEVTVIEVLDRILINEDSIVSTFVDNELTKMGIRIITGAKIDEIKEENEQIKINVNGLEIVANKILSAVGRGPYTEGLNIDALGAEMKNERGAIIVNEFLQTNCPNIYAIGDVTAGVMLAHTASAQATLTVDNIFDDKQVKWDKSFVPRCIYIEPEIAAVGVVEDEIKGKMEYLTSLYPFAANGKAIALEKERGFIKVIVSADTNQILGITIVGERATDMICLAMEFVRNKATIEEVEGGIYPHPTFSEALHEAILKVVDKAIHV